MHDGQESSFLSPIIENGREMNRIEENLSRGHLTRALGHLDESFEDLEVLSNYNYLRLAMIRLYTSNSDSVG